MRYTTLKITFTALIFCVSFYMQGQTLTLQECVELALEKNITIKQSELDIANAELDKSNAFGNFLPNINAQTSHSWNIGLNQNITTGLLENLTTQFSSLGVNMGVDIYNGLQNVKRLHRANLAIIAQQYNLADITDDTALLVANSYLQVMFNREQLGVQESQFAVSLKELERTKILIEAGVLTTGDIFELEATIASQQQAVVQAQNNLRLTKINLAQLLLITDYENFDIAVEAFDVPFPQILDETPKAIFEKALSDRNDIKLSLTNLEISKTDIEIAKTSLQPSLSAFYSYSTRISYSDRLTGTGVFNQFPIGTVAATGQEVVTQVEQRGVIGPSSFVDQLQTNDGHNFGIQLSIPILNGFSAKNNVKRSKVNLMRFENQFEQQKLGLESTVNQAYNDAKGAFNFYKAAQKTVIARNDAYQDATKRFDAGVMNSFEFTQIKQRYEASVSDELRAKFDYVFKLKVLEFYFGLKLEI
ncbi:MAG: TolC family protein [Flavobacteriales bacterium]|jgi:outer membrane protein|nr:TolC family protein [Flavobacteriaceae bacterium]MDO7581283.1 TolC family protein [Flavobacteriaceae bacterium]MDO7590831.1 TolC family protein [Flavobacteriaceae bacterium]MDO7598851.1 TolC family protein [Flavobacteriaceae bacterium]MDO7603598.1 TolC family protein [Flavobacteriaceae bacterium]|tara:strand:+ start:148 stop:1572 length:1425 start_codon:yes stop_codon:yes gene_type:complete